MESVVSIIIPIYNVQDFLDRCINSIIEQTYKKIEIILVDDGSTDLCPQKCDEWADKDCRITVIHKKNEGLGYARNTGLDIASGDYITFVDSDDYLPLDAIQLMVNRIQEDKSDLVVGKKTIVYSDGTQELSGHMWLQDMVKSRNEAMRMIGDRECPFPAAVWAKLYKKSIFDETRFTNLSCSEDLYILPFVVEKCNTVSFLNSTVYFYYQRSTSIIHNIDEKRQFDRIIATLTVARFLFDYNYITEASHFYEASKLYFIAIRHNKTAKQLINSSFTKSERKLLNKKTKKDVRSVLAYRFPNIYKFYKRLCKNRKKKN